MRRFDFDEAILRESFGIGVAGNFAGHLEQAGEARDFTSVVGAVDAPKGIFPFYAAGCRTFLDEFPLSSGELRIPADGEPNVQIEPELGLLCAVDYSASGVSSLQPLAVTAFNDCSIRRPDAAKISEKKNWGSCSKGAAANGFAVSEIDRTGDLAAFRIGCFLQRGEELHVYGVDSGVAEYSYFGDQLLSWIVDRLNGQRGSSDSPLEDVGSLLNSCGSPRRLMVGVGATRYTDFGETHFLRHGDDSVVVLYDGATTSAADVAAAIAERDDARLADAAVLRQRVVAVV